MLSGGGGPSGGLGIRFLCSFSLPVITICAMIMLSIIISLLNIFLGWMAWVKICLADCRSQEMSASLFVGWPLDAPDPTGRLAYAADAQCLREALWNVLMTNPGERLMRPDFGAGLEPMDRPAQHREHAAAHRLLDHRGGRRNGSSASRSANVSVAADPNGCSRASIVTLSYTARGQPARRLEQLSLSPSLSGGG